MNRWTIYLDVVLPVQVALFAGLTLATAWYDAGAVIPCAAVTLFSATLKAVDAWLTFRDLQKSPV